jgi:hypothetical protein
MHRYRVPTINKCINLCIMRSDLSHFFHWGGNAVYEDGGQLVQVGILHHRRGRLVEELIIFIILNHILR